MDVANLRAWNLHKAYHGRSVVKGIGFHVSQGEVVGFLGPNGAGKTTCFYMLAGLVLPDEGRIDISGEDITDNPIHQRAFKGIGYLPQEASVFRDLSVEENIYAVLENTKLPTAKKKNMLENLLDEFHLGRIRTSRGGDISGGERRRVEVARALALEPRFILLDEPFAGVDPLSIGDIQGIIKGLKRKNIGVLITDHNVRETFGIVDRAYIIHGGTVFVEGTPKELVANEEVAKLYLGEDFKL